MCVLTPVILIRSPPLRGSPGRSRSRGLRLVGAGQRVQAEHELLVALHDLRRDGPRRVGVAGLDRLDQAAVRLDARVEVAEAPDRRLGARAPCPRAAGCGCRASRAAGSGCPRSPRARGGTRRRRRGSESESAAAAARRSRRRRSSCSLAGVARVAASAASCVSMTSRASVSSRISSRSMGRGERHALLRGHRARDVGAAARLCFDQSAADQHADRLADGADADAVLLRQLAVAGQAGARRQLAGEDAAAHAVGDVDRQGRALEWPRSRRVTVWNSWQGSGTYSARALRVKTLRAVDAQSLRSLREPWNHAETERRESDARRSRQPLSRLVQSRPLAVQNSLIFRFAATAGPAASRERNDVVPPGRRNG